jgi:hypothetical protein
MGYVEVGGGYGRMVKEKQPNRKKRLIFCSKDFFDLPPYTKQMFGYS